MSRPCRAPRARRSTLEAYLRARPAIGDAPLFPAKKDPTRPMTKMDAYHLLRRAEALAELPRLERGAFHCYRRLFLTERKHLPDVDVAKAGGWRDLATMRRSYQQSDPATVLRAIENAPESEGAGHAPDTPRRASGDATTASPRG